MASTASVGYLHGVIYFQQGSKYPCKVKATPLKQEQHENTLGDACCYNKMGLSNEFERKGGIHNPCKPIFWPILKFFGQIKREMDIVYYFKLSMKNNIFEPTGFGPRGVDRPQ